MKLSASELKVFEPSEHIPSDLSHILPVCPCGCKGRLAEFFPATKLSASYYEKEKFDGMSMLQIERKIIFTEQWEEEPLTHWMRHLKLFAPWVTHDPNTVRAYQKSLDLEEKKVKIHGMMGHASSSKSNFIVCRSFQEIDIFPDNSEVYVASPYKTSGEYLLWKQFKIFFENLKETGYTIFKNQDKVITLSAGRNEGVGTIRYIGLDKESSMRGAKMIDMDIGHILICLDEVGEFPNFSIFDIFANLKSQNGFRAIAGTNFGGTEIERRLYDPINTSWDGLSREFDYEWVGGEGCEVDRYRASTSPNIAMGVDYYKYLLRSEGHDELLKYGIDSSLYLKQGDSFLTPEIMSNIIITRQDIDGAGCYQDVRLEPTFREHFGSCDPSFTAGGDNMVFTYGQLSEDQDLPKNHEGERRKLRIMRQDSVKVPRKKDTKRKRNDRMDELEWTAERLELANSLRVTRGGMLRDGIFLGAELSAFDFCALESAKFCRRYGIPFNNFGYDDSMDGRLTSSMKYFMGDGVREYHYGGVPDKRIAFPLKYKFEKGQQFGANIKTPMTNYDKHDKYASQIFYTTAEMLRQGYVKNVGKAEEGIKEMISRLKSKNQRNARKDDIEIKSEYKARNKNKSPDFCDSLCILCNMVVELRLTPHADTSNNSNSGNFTNLAHFIDMLTDEVDDYIQPLSR